MKNKLKSAIVARTEIKKITIVRFDGKTSRTIYEQVYEEHGFKQISKN